VSNQFNKNGVIGAVSQDYNHLADALAYAGCSYAELLGYLRGPGPHVRGCWAVDVVLGKE
jgi:hypothetical protein